LFIRRNIMNQLYVILLLLGFYLPSAAQNLSTTDSLKQVLTETTEPAEKLPIYFQLAYNSFRNDIPQSREYTLQALQLSQQLADSANYYKALFYLGLVHRFEANYDSAMHYFQNVHEYYIENEQESQAVFTLFNMGVISNYRGWWNKSLEYFMEGLQVAEESGEEAMQGEMLNSIGLVHLELKNFDQALSMVKQALVIFRRLERIPEQTNCVSNIGSIYSDMHQQDSALYYFKKSLELNELEDNNWGMAMSLFNIGFTYFELGLHKDALKNLEQSLKIRQQLGGYQREIADSYTNIAQVYVKTGRSNQALPYALKAKVLADSLQVPQELRDAHQVLAQIYADLGQYEQSYLSQDIVTTINDSLYNAEITRQVSELQAQYETEKKEKEIILLTQEREVQEAELDRKNTFLIASIIGCILLSSLIIVTVGFYRSKMKSRALITQKNEEINQRKIQELQQKQKLVSMDAMVTGQEEERKRIAKDLHDGLGSLLADVQMRFSSMKDTIQTERSSAYQQTNTLLDEACQEVRKIAHDMMPGALVKFGLVPAIQDSCSSLEKNTGIHVDFQVYGINERLEEKVEITIYRIVQELLSNIRKHAQAQEIIVQLSVHEGLLTLVVEDDGVGFDLATARAKDSLGLRSLESRAKYINGTLSIDAVLSQGTTVTIEAPVTQEVALV
ncbi:MAG: sensor histidine kinase, partial [Bacteroidota bacterium]